MSTYALNYFPKQTMGNIFNIFSSSTEMPITQKTESCNTILKIGEKLICKNEIHNFSQECSYQSILLNKRHHNNIPRNEIISVIETAPDEIVDIKGKVINQTILLYDRVIGMKSDISKSKFEKVNNGYKLFIELFSVLLCIFIILAVENPAFFPSEAAITGIIMLSIGIVGLYIDKKSWVGQSARRRK